VGSCTQDTFCQDPTLERELGSCTRTPKIPKDVIGLTGLGGKQQQKDVKEE